MSSVILQIRKFQNNVKLLQSRKHFTTSTQRKEANDKKSTIDQDEIENHKKWIKEWWDPNGHMAGLHALNLLRVPFIRDGLVDNNQRASCHPLTGKSILEVGCGAGILSEPLAKLGANVTGLDAGDDLINLARHHSEMHLKENKPTYVCDSVENHASMNKNIYDGVVASEVIEHVDNKELFVKSCVETLKPGGRIFFTTPCRTRINQIAGIFLAENVFKVLPKGLHQYEKFMTPTELTFMLERNNCVVEAIHGAFYYAFTNKWEWVNTTAFLFALQAKKNP